MKNTPIMYDADTGILRLDINNPFSQVKLKLGNQLKLMKVLIEIIDDEK